VFSVDQLFYWQTNTGKFGKWFPENHFSENKHSQRENTFLKTKPNFSLTGKCFLLTGKCFPLIGKCSPLTGKCSPLTGKCFPLTNFPNGKQTQEGLESGFLESEFRETNTVIYN
jgi:hypothetical protein